MVYNTSGLRPQVRANVTPPKRTLTVYLTAVFTIEGLILLARHGELMSTAIQYPGALNISPYMNNSPRSLEKPDESGACVHDSHFICLDAFPVYLFMVLLAWAHVSVSATIKYKAFIVTAAYKSLVLSSSHVPSS